MNQFITPHLSVLLVLLRAINAQLYLRTIPYLFRCVHTFLRDEPAANVTVTVLPLPVSSVYVVALDERIVAREGIQPTGKARSGEMHQTS